MGWLGGPALRGSGLYSALGIPSVGSSPGTVRSSHPTTRRRRISDPDISLCLNRARSGVVVLGCPSVYELLPSLCYFHNLLTIKAYGVAG